MKRSSTFYTLLLTLFVATVAVAQIPQESPFPVEVFFTTPDGAKTTVEYVSTTDFGDTLQETLTGELALAFDDGIYDADGDGEPDDIYTANENCSWETTMGDVAGKIAVIRRGSCFFSQKIYNVQQAGAIGAIVCNTADRDPVGGMSGADSAEVAVIPAVFIEFGPCEQIYSALEADQTMTATFQVSFAFSPFGPNNYATPLTNVTALDNIEFTVFNPSSTDAVTDVMGTAEILEPGGTVTTLDATLATLDPLTGGVISFDSYTPTEVGEYAITMTNSLTEDVLVRNFAVTDYTFAADNGNVIRTTAGTIEPSDEGFVEDGLNYDAGIYYITGEGGGTATYASFMISNPDELFTNDEESDLFTVILYDTDGDGDGVTNVTTGTTYEDYRPVGFGTYILNEEDVNEPFELYTVEFDGAVTLRPNNQYILMVRYNGVNAALGIPPKYAFAGNDSYISLRNGGEENTAAAGNDVVFTDQLYTDGWAGADYNYVARLHLEGFEPVSNVVELLDEGSVLVAPNPTADFVNVTFNLAETADDVTLRLFDFAGKLVNTTRYENVNQTTLPVNLENLPSGTYFLSVETPEGFSAQKITKL
ncbi:MAG: PA domain-containing protein [Saprospiraceae bacterium]